MTTETKEGNGMDNIKRAQLAADGLMERIGITGAVRGDILRDLLVCAYIEGWLAGIDYGTDALTDHLTKAGL